MYERIQETASWLKERMTTSPKTAIILGTGLGQLASEITDSYDFPYSEIPNFPVSTVEGHAGRLIFGKLGGKDIMAMEGRFHYYEGYSMKEVTFPERVMYELGITTLFVSNAGVQGPTFETPAEYRMYRLLGGDAVGMSTVPEVIVARHCGIKTFGVSIITDLGGFDVPVEVSHEEVQKAANSAQPLMTEIMREMIRRS